MTVSFCVIAYNEGEAIGSLFQNIQNQNYPHELMEVILVNAMSTDNTRKLMEEFAQENDGFLRVRVLDNPKKIQAAGWNVAIAASQEDVILRIDAHTMIPKDFVSKTIACIEEGEDVVGGQRPNILEEFTPWKNTLLLAEKSMFGSSIAPYRTGHQKNYVKSVFHGAYRREIFQKVGYFNENLGRTEDNEMHYRIRQAGYRICYNPTIISYQHTRNSLKAMIQQKFGNGYWIGLTLGICPRCFSVFHFIPLCFVLTILVSGVFALAGEKRFFIFLLLIYGGINIFMSVWATLKKKKYWQYVFLPVIFLLLHIAYGIGTAIGLVEMPFWKRKIKRNEEEQVKYFE